MWDKSCSSSALGFSPLHMQIANEYGRPYDILMNLILDQIKSLFERDLGKVVIKEIGDKTPPVEVDLSTTEDIITRARLLVMLRANKQEAIDEAYKQANLLTKTGSCEIDTTNYPKPQ